MEITNKPIDKKEFYAALDNPTAGAVVGFEGLVRNHNEGLSVDALEYEVFASMALNEGKKILSEALEQFNISEIKATHREGRLNIGEAAVIVAAASSHRDAAFKACRYVIDEIKHRLPIWKKEHYTNQPAEWVDCKGCYHHSHVDFSESDYYSKHDYLNDPCQKAMKSSKVLVVGAGSLGCAALSHLVGAGCGEITIWDESKISISDLAHQTMFAYDEAGQLKSVAAKQRLSQINPFVKISAMTDVFNGATASENIKNFDLVMDCSDSSLGSATLLETCVDEKVILIPFRIQP